MSDSVERITLAAVREKDGRREYRAVYPTGQTYRFLMEDGSVVDVHAYSDDSNLRAAIVKECGGIAIVGRAVIKEDG